MVWGLGSLKRHNPIAISTGLAHLLAWAAMLFLALGPVYQGTSTALMTAGGVAGEPTRGTATLIQVNGLSVLPLLLFPVFLTALGLWAVLKTDLRRIWARGLLRASAAVLLVLCLVGIGSIGLFYLPAAMVLLFSAVKGSRRLPTRTTVNGDGSGPAQRVNQ